MRTDILGVGFDDLTMDEAVSAAYSRLDKRDAAYVVTPNPEIVWLCREDAALAEALGRAYLVLPDGVGIVYGARILGRPLKEKIPGIDFASALMERMARDGRSVFLLGAKPGVADRAAERLTAMYPGLVVAGTHNGYYKNDGPVVDMINAASPDLLLVCLGAPKQEKWMDANREKLSVGLMAGLGGCLDVYAGLAERAPEGWQNAGFEWLYRLLKEPKRIKRMAKLPLFAAAVCGQRVRGK